MENDEPASREIKRLKDNKKKMEWDALADWSFKPEYSFVATLQRQKR